MSGGGADPTTASDVATGTGAFSGGPALPSGPQEAIGAVGGNNPLGISSSTPAWLQALSAIGGLAGSPQTQQVGQQLGNAISGPSPQMGGGGGSPGLLNRQMTQPTMANPTGFSPVPSAQAGAINPVIQQALLRLMSGGKF